MSDPGFPSASPRWSHDGRLIAFVRYRTTYFRGPLVCCELWVTAADGSSARRIAGSFDGEWAEQPMWNPDGRLAFVTGPRAADGTARSELGEVHLARADGSGDRRVLPSRRARPVRLLGWNSAGDRLVLTTGGVGYGTTELDFVQTDGSPPVGLGAWPEDLWCCWISPDASAGVALAKTATGEQLRVILFGCGCDGSVLAEGVSAQARVVTTASWSPDAREVAYLADGECATFIGVYVAGSGKARRVTNPCRRVGTPRRDTLMGTVDADAIFGRGGDDNLDGWTGPDYLDGGPGDDVVYGNNGDDRLVGGRGRDRLVGGSGWDRVYAQDGARDIIVCGAGRDGVRADRIDRVARDCEVVERT